MSNKSQGILSWSQTERPRERLISQGVEALSDAELLALLLRSGTLGKDAVSLAKEILSQTGGLRGLFSLEVGELTGLHGLGFAKAASLLAANEIVQRRLRECIVNQNILQDPQAVLDYLYSSLRDKKQEIFKVFFLNKSHRLLDEQNLFKGTVDAATLYPREILKEALDRRATALILVHNHPSGRVEPSSEDKEMTRRLESACRTVSIDVLDHIIVGDNIYFSFYENNLMNFQK